MPRSCLPAWKSRFESGGKVSQGILAELRPIFYPRAVVLVAASDFTTMPVRQMGLKRLLG